MKIQDLKNNTYHQIFLTGNREGIYYVKTFYNKLEKVEEFLKQPNILKNIDDAIWTSLSNKNQIVNIEVFKENYSKELINLITHCFFKYHNKTIENFFSIDNLNETFIRLFYNNDFESIINKKYKVDFISENKKRLERIVNLDTNLYYIVLNTIENFNLKPSNNWGSDIIIDYKEKYSSSLEFVDNEDNSNNYSEYFTDNDGRLMAFPNALQLMNFMYDLGFEYVYNGSQKHGYYKKIQ
jgi:hypothetical protein